MGTFTRTARFYLPAILFLLAGEWLLAQTTTVRSVSSRLKDAASQISAGRLDQAERELQSVLRSSPREYRALDLLGVIRVLQRQETKAEELFTQAVNKKPDFAPGHAHLGLLYLQLGRTPDAVRELREALRLDSSRTDAAGALVRLLQDQARVAYESGDFNGALASLKDARKYAPDNAEIQYAFGMTALQLSLQDDAIEAFQQTLKLRKDDALAVYNLGHAFMEQSKFDEAREQFARYVELRPDDPSGHCALGMTLAALERSPEARAQFDRSIALAPTQIESYYRLGLLNLNDKDYKAANENFRHVLAGDPQHAAALTGLGKVEFEQKHYPEAVSFLQEAVSKDDSMREAHYYLGLTFARLGRKQESAEQLEVAARMEHEEAEHRRTVLRILEPGSPEAQRSSVSK